MGEGGWLEIGGLTPIADTENFVSNFSLNSFKAIPNSHTIQLKPEIAHFCSIISASLAIRIAEQSAIVIDHVVPRLSVRTSLLWQNG